ncbi:uncharacterized protein LOC110098972 [Dendrobium catenatum]|uniref:Wound-responsive family protein n=1 Tax=Dendrobium catenatum TaxID=906689 RepID=A0A2I0X1J6_9ASPA|nr:uncharacterized protein LOC110098972 [Dendrobium catenatum]PKU81757.1 hypothetical protein MA16_Dca018699 [Dendrobium catenatum]
MASGSRASLIVAASISAVEALKDQSGLCRWNYAIRSVQQKARKEMGSLSQATKAPSSSSSMMAGSIVVSTRGEQVKRAEESFRNVMFLSCWGPN